LSDFVNNVSTSNLVDGKPAYYLINQSNIVISPSTCPEGVGYLGLVNCKNVTVQGMTLTKNDQGLLLANTNDSKVTDNNATANSDGIDLEYSSGNDTLSGNNITANYAGIFLSSSGNVVSGNNLTANSWVGIFLEGSSGNVLSGNKVAAHGYGIFLDSSSNNTFYHNNFIRIGNPPRAPQVYSDGSSNTWDNGYPSGGNYWSDYSGADQKCGTGQNMTGSDGIGDTPYIIDANNTDRYPLMAPFHTFRVGTFNGTAYSVDTVSNSTITNVSFNATAKTLSFNVTGTNGTTGFCRATIPLSLMSGEWTVTVNGTSIAYSTITDGNYTYIYFTYHHSTETVQITSTIAIPEFQPYMLLPLLIFITLLTAAVSKRKRKVVHVTKPAKE
jgi:parallel beta-helix repeat protein